MVVALLVGAVKYVAMYVIAHKYRSELGSLSMLFWCQIFTMAFVVPWSIADGELHNLVSVASIKTQLWVFSAAGLGGVRFLSQILALGMMSPTSLSVVNVGAHLLVASIVLLAGIQTLPGKAGSLGMLISGLTVAVIGAHSHRTRLLRYDGPRTTRTPHAHHTHTPPHLSSSHPSSPQASRGIPTSRSGSARRWACHKKPSRTAPSASPPSSIAGGDDCRRAATPTRRVVARPAAARPTAAATASRPVGTAPPSGEDSRASSPELRRSPRTDPQAQRDFDVPSLPRSYLFSHIAV